jgi:hypothetical protein
LRPLKYLAIALIVLAIIAAVAHYKRESIAREIANTALRGQGLVATDLSIDTLATDRIRLSRLVLLADNGTRYELNDVSFPLNFPSADLNTISAGNLVLTPPEKATATPLSTLLHTFLALPDSLPETEVTLSQFFMEDLPPIRDLAWRSAGDNQHLSFRIDAIAVSGEFLREDGNLHNAVLTASTAKGDPALSLPLSIRRTPAGYSMDGPMTLNIAPWLPILHTLGILPQAIAALDARMTGTVTAELFDDANVPANFQGDLAVDDTLSATYAVSADASIDVRGALPDRVAFDLAYPALEWTAEIPQSSLRVSAGAFSDVPLSVTNLRCRSDLSCEMHVSTDGYATAFGAIRVGNLHFGGKLEARIAEETRIALSPDFKLNLGEVASDAFTAASISATLISEAIVRLDDGGWNAEAAKVDLLLESATDRNTLLATLPVTFSSLRIGDNAQIVESGFEIAARVASIQWDGIDLVTPGAAGTLSLEDNIVEASFDLSDAAGAISAGIEGDYDTAAARGSLSVREASLYFDRQPLSALLQEWPYPWDLVSGAWTADMALDFAAGKEGWNYDGTLTQSVRSLAGHYNEIVFTGLDTDLSATIGSDEGIAVSPSSLSLALLDVGLPIEQLTAQFEADAAGQAVTVTDLGMSVLGGKILADPFRYRLKEESNDIVLRPQSIQLQFMVDLAEFEDVEMSGSISGVIPVTVSGKTITVAGGRLESDAPGGVIHYRAGAAAEAVSNEGINVVTRALGNFQFDSLTSDVDYTEAGDLKLQMRMSGINPDMDANQPVILNLGVENNIPQLLRSLQATRAIEDLLQRKGNE